MGDNIHPFIKKKQNGLMESGTKRTYVEKRKIDGSVRKLIDKSLFSNIDKILNQFCKDGDKFKLPDVLSPVLNCKDCYGKGYDSVKTNGKKKEERKVVGFVLCSCIFKKTKKVVEKIKNGQSINLTVEAGDINWEKKYEIK